MTQDVFCCPHTRGCFAKGYTRTGSVQVREVCPDCGANVRPGQVNVPHVEVPDLDALPVLFDHRPSADQLVLFPEGQP